MPQDEAKDEMIEDVEGLLTEAETMGIAGHNKARMALLGAAARIRTLSADIERMRNTLKTAHIEMACAIGFCRRGPRPDKMGESAPAKNWASMCSEIADELAKADQIILAALNPNIKDRDA